MKFFHIYNSHSDYTNDIDNISFPNIVECRTNTDQAEIHYNGYIFLDCIKLDRQDYYGQIDTGVYGDLNTKIVCDYMVTGHLEPEIHANALFGSEEGYHVNSFSFMAEVNDTRTRVFSLGQQFKSHPGQVLNTKYHAEFSSTFKFTDQSNYSFPSQSSFTTWDSIYLFDLHRYSSTDENWYQGYKNRFIGNLYNFDIYKNDVLVRKFRPAMRLSDNFVSLFDMVENKFYMPTQNISFIGGHPLRLKLKTFTICISTSTKPYDKEYYFEEGMTWEEWINSDYNSEYVIYNGGIYTSSITSQVQLNNVNVQSNEFILENTNYLLKYIGGGSSD